MRSHRHQGKNKERKVRRSQDNNIFFQGDQTGHELCSVHQHPHPLYFSYIVCCFFFLPVYLPLKGWVHYNKITFLLWSSMAFIVQWEISDFYFLRPSTFLQRWFRSFWKRWARSKKMQSYVLAGCFRLLQRNLSVWVSAQHQLQDLRKCENFPL